MTLATKRSRKQTREARDYIFDLSEWFSTRDDTLASASLVVPTGISAVLETVGLRLRVTVSGGEPDNEYNIAILITTTASTPVIREIDLYVEIQEQ
jgi:hypothetical protein